MISFHTSNIIICCHIPAWVNITMNYWRIDRRLVKKYIQLQSGSSFGAIFLILESRLYQINNKPRGGCIVFIRRMWLFFVDRYLQKINIFYIYFCDKNCIRPTLWFSSYTIVIHDTNKDTINNLYLCIAFYSYLVDRLVFIYNRTKFS